LDLVVVKYTHLINGYKYLNLTKLDVLTGFASLKVGVGYKIGGKAIEGIPANLEILAQVEVEYIEVPGWKEDIAACKTMEELPQTCQDYIRLVESSVGVPVKWIGVGSGRLDMIERSDV